MLFEIGSVDDEHDDLGRGLAFEFAVDDLARHLLVGARGIEAVGTRQVDQLERFSARQRQPAGLALYRDAGIIGDLLPRAGQRVEQGRLARIGVADQRGDTFGVMSSTSIAAVVRAVRWSSGRRAPPAGRGSRKRRAALPRPRRLRRCPALRRLPSLSSRPSPAPRSRGLPFSNPSSVSAPHCQAARWLQPVINSALFARAYLAG